MELESLTRALGVSGFEEEVRRLILGAVKDGEVDEFGNVLTKTGKSKVAFVAHMDEVGLLVTSIEEDGRLKFRKVGGVDGRILPGSSVVLYGDGFKVEGVIGVAPPHFQQQQQQVSWQDLYIDIGAASRQEAESMGIGPMTPAAFSRRYSNMGKFVSATALDDRAGCWVLLEAYRRAAATYVWTVQEEVGLMGARALSRRLDVSYVVVVDTMACCHPNWTGGVKPGNGPVLRLFDNYGAYNNKLAKKVLEVAKRRGIPIQIGSGGGGTDAGAFFAAGIPAVAIGILTKYSHSPVEMAHKDDLKHAVELVVALAEELA
ncbi:M42 family metallopeptidase [Pyrobaculum sp.]|uniref:M42 family metallopeptidase n=1 Tax=Pyrobaculum sp. TaxID=2004705 RepID=UPI00317DCA47